MSKISSDAIIDLIENYVVSHCGLDDKEARTFTRAFAWGEVPDLPQAATEVGRIERAGLLQAITSALAPVMPEAVASATPIVSPAPAPVAEPALPSLTGEARAAAIRAMAGPDRQPTAEALIASASVTVSDAATVLAAASAAVQGARAPSASAWWRQAEFQGEGFAGIDVEPSPKSTAAQAGWARAFSKVTGSESVEAGEQERLPAAREAVREGWARAFQRAEASKPVGIRG